MNAASSLISDIAGERLPRLLLRGPICGRADLRTHRPFSGWKRRSLRCRHAGHGGARDSGQLCGARVLPPPDSPAVYQGDTSATVAEKVENDGNVTLDLTTITVSGNAAIEGTVTNPCSNSETLAVSADCEIGAVFAPAATPILTAKQIETGTIDVSEDSQSNLAAPNSPLDIEVVGMALPANSTTTTVSSSLNPSGYEQSVTFTVTVTTGTGNLTGTVSLTDAFNGIATTLVSGLRAESTGRRRFRFRRWRSVSTRLPPHTTTPMTRPTLRAPQRRWPRPCWRAQRSL